MKHTFAYRNAPKCQVTVDNDKWCGKFLFKN